MYPKVLKVETGFSSLKHIRDAWWTDILDHEIYKTVPLWWRRIEEKLHLDIILALRARSLADQYDIIWADSEKVGIPLSLLRLQKPLVVISHHLESQLKARFVRITGMSKRWAGIGCISNQSRRFFVDYLGVPNNRLFQFESAKYLKISPPAGPISNGPIISIGVAKRDYNTLIEAVANLPGYETELFVSSKFGDRLAGHIRVGIPEWVRIMNYLPIDQLMMHYQKTRFVVVSLEETTHNGAGINAVLEAGAFGKAVIATKTGGMSSFVRDGETGILVPPYDSVALRSAINKLWTQPELACQMGKAGRAHMEAEFDPELVDSHIKEFLIKIYRESRSC